MVDSVESDPGCASTTMINIRSRSDGILETVTMFCLAWFGSNCLQKLSTKDVSRLQVKVCNFPMGWHVFSAADKNY